MAFYIITNNTGNEIKFPNNQTISAATSAVHSIEDYFEYAQYDQNFLELIDNGDLTLTYSNGDPVDVPKPATNLHPIQELYVPSDGRRAFTAPVSGVGPMMGNHFATKTFTEETSANALAQSIEYTDTLVAATSGGLGAVIGLGEWRYDTSTTPPPTDKQFNFNNASLESATKFYLDYTNQNGDDLANILSSIAGSNTILYFQQRKDANKAFWVHASVFTDQTTYGEFDIENAEDFGNSIDTNKNYSLIIGNIGGGDVAVFGSEYNYAASETESSTTSTSWQNKIDFDIDVAAGTYVLHWYSEIRMSSTSYSVRARVDKDGVGVETLASIEIEPQDSDNWYPFSGTVELDLDGIHDIDLEYSRVGGGGTAYIRRARFMLWRIS